MSVELHERFLIAAPSTPVWALLRQPRVVAECMPGTELTAENPDGTFDGRITLRFGPTTAAFSGTASITVDDTARAGTIEARGTDTKRSTRASAVTSVRLVGDGDGCLLHIDTTIDVSGPLAQFARTGGTQVLRALLGDFSSALAERAAAGGSDGPVGDRVVTPRREISVVRVLWLVVRDAFARLRSKVTRRRKTRAGG